MKIGCQTDVCAIKHLILFAEDCDRCYPEETCTFTVMQLEKRFTVTIWYLATGFIPTQLHLELHLHLCSMRSQCVSDHLWRWFGWSDHKPFSVHCGCIYTWTFMWSSTIRLQFDHQKCISMHGVKGWEWFHRIKLVSSSAGIFEMCEDILICRKHRGAAHQTRSLSHQFLIRPSESKAGNLWNGVCVCVFVPLWWSVCHSCCRSLISAHIWGHGVSHSAPSPGSYLPLSGSDLELWTTETEEIVCDTTLTFVINS